MNNIIYNYNINIFNNFNIYIINLNLIKWECFWNTFNITKRHSIANFYLMNLNKINISKVK